MNQTSLLLKREGLYYGQCSKICGKSRRFMPIVIEAVKFRNFIFIKYLTY